MTKFAKDVTVSSMTTMNVSLPDELKSFVDERVEHDGYGSTSEYVRELIRRDRERVHLRELVLEGATPARAMLLTLPTSTHCASASRRKPELLAAKLVQFRDLATFDLESASSYYVAEADVATAIRFVDAVEATRNASAETLASDR